MKMTLIILILFSQVSFAKKRTENKKAKAITALFCPVCVFHLSKKEKNVIDKKRFPANINKNKL